MLKTKVLSPEDVGKAELADAFLTQKKDSLSVLVAANLRAAIYKLLCNATAVKARRTWVLQRNTLSGINYEAALRVADVECRYKGMLRPSPTMISSLSIGGVDIITSSAPAYIATLASSKHSVAHPSPRPRMDAHRHRPRTHGWSRVAAVRMECAAATPPVALVRPLCPAPAIGKRYPTLRAG